MSFVDGTQHSALTLLSTARRALLGCGRRQVRGATRSGLAAAAGGQHGLRSCCPGTSPQLPSGESEPPEGAVLHAWEEGR